MDQTITGTFWGEPLEEVKLRTQLDRKAVGVRDHGKVAKQQREPHEITQQTGTTELNARQLVALMRGVVCYDADPNVHPPWCDDPPLGMVTHTVMAQSLTQRKNFLR